MPVAKTKQNKSKFQQNRNPIFPPRKKQIIEHLNFRISGQKIITYSNIKYVGITWE